MPYTHSHRNDATTRNQPPLNPAEIDPFLIADEFDDDLDRHLAAIRESLADSRNL
jgi:hypothetical protein